MKLMNLAWAAYSALPPAVRQKLRSVLKRGSGHESSRFNSAIAMRNAAGKCRIDRFARMLSDDLNACGMVGIEGSRCLEIGTGYVASSPVVMWLLGAQSVTTIDLNPLWVPASLKASILPVDRQVLLQILKPHVASEERLRERIDRVYQLAALEQADLRECFNYRAPFDLLSDAFDTDFDFIFSTSTLEHIPRSLVSRFVDRTAALLAPDGVAMHFIDLMDHFDRAGNPFGFLTLEAGEYSEDLQADSRGNRIRAAEWLEIFARAGLRADIPISLDATPAEIPARLAAPFATMSLQNLMPTSILVRAARQGSAATFPGAVPPADRHQ